MNEVKQAEGCLQQGFQEPFSQEPDFTRAISPLSLMICLQPTDDIYQNILNVQQDIDKATSSFGKQRHPHQFLRPYIQALMQTDPMITEKYGMLHPLLIEC